MSLSRKRSAKALRALYGVDGGVRPAKTSQERRCWRTDPDEPRCNQPTKVVSAGVPLCAGHFADETRVRRR